MVTNVVTPFESEKKELGSELEESIVQLELQNQLPQKQEVLESEKAVLTKSNLMTLRLQQKFGSHSLKEGQEQRSEMLQEDVFQRVDFTRQLEDLTFQDIQGKFEAKQCFDLFDPDSGYKSFWDIMGLFFIVYQAFIVPFRISFSAEPSKVFGFFENIQDFYFIIDIFVNFNTGTYSRGKKLFRRKQAAINYIKSWFFIDLVASFPCDWIINGTITETNHTGTTKIFQLARILKVARLLLVLRLLRILKLKQLVYRFEEFFFNESVSMFLAFLKMFLIIFFIAHWMSCLFFGISNLQDETGNDSWIRKENIQDSRIDEQYIHALYWSFMTMTTVGYGDVVPNTSNEKIVTILIMVVSCAVFAWIMGSIGSIVRMRDTSMQQLKDESQQINAFMIANKLPQPFRKKVKRHLDYLIEYKTQYKLEEEEVIEMLSENLRDELYIHLNGSMLHQTQALQKFDIVFLAQLTYLLQKETYSSNELIFRESNIERKIYFITDGQVNLYSNSTKTMIKTLE